MSVAGNLKVVPASDAWAVTSLKLGYSACLKSTPAEALAAFILAPQTWPEDVDFWMGVAAKMHKRSALGYIAEGRKRPEFHSVRQLRPDRFPSGKTFHYADHCGGYVVADFWFVAAIMEVLHWTGFSFTCVSDDARTEYLLANVEYAELCTALNIRRRKDWAQDFIVVDPQIASWMGITPVIGRQDKKWSYITGYNDERGRNAR